MIQSPQPNRGGFLPTAPVVVSGPAAGAPTPAAFVIRVDPTQVKIIQ